MSTSTAAMNEVDQEIEARKLSLRGLKEAHAARNGTHPDKAPLGRAELDAAMPGHGAGSRKEAEARKAASPQEQRVLDAAARRYKPGEAVSPKKLADDLGLKPMRVSVFIDGLRKKSLWPYAASGRGGRPLGGKAAGPAAEYPALKAKINGEAPPATRPIPQPATEPEPEPDLRVPDPEPIRNTDPKADAELLVIQRVLAQLARLPTDRARRRVLVLLADRADEDAQCHA